MLILSCSDRGGCRLSLSSRVLRSSFVFIVGCRAVRSSTAFRTAVASEGSKGVESPAEVLPVLSVWIEGGPEGGRRVSITIGEGGGGGIRRPSPPS